MIEALRDAGARAVVIDLVLADPRPGDAALARAIARDGAPVVLAAAGQLPFNAPRTQWASFTLAHPNLWHEGPLPPSGVVTAPLESDGRLRYLWLTHRAEGRTLAAMPLAVLNALKEPQQAALDAQGRVTLALRNDAQSGVHTLPFAPLAMAAQRGELNHSSLRAANNQVVFIGSSALLSDAALTPVGQLNGTAVLAQAYAALRDGRTLSAAPSTLTGVLLALALLPSLWALLRGRTEPWLACVAAAAGTILLGALMPWWVVQHQRWIDPSPALLALALGLVLHLVIHQRWTQKQSRRLLQEQRVAEQANQAKSVFLANMSHELRTPLAAVLGLSELLSKSLMPEPQQRQVQLLQRAGRSLLTLIDELLDLSRIDMNRLAIASAPTELPVLLNDAIDMMQARATERRVRCELVAHPDLPRWVLADRLRLQQVLLNLLGNAIKFTPRGQVQLLVGLLPDGRIQFSVTDTGIGIAASQLQRIFEPFLQAQGQDGTRYGGSGLGLAISRQLVRLMGGDIDVLSVPGAGSRFAFALNLPPCEAPSAPPAPPAELAGDLRVLLAEDDDVSAEVLIAQLQPYGVAVDRANNGHLALTMAQRERYDVVLLDLQMPGLNGHEVARAIREHESATDQARTPVLALSAHAYAEDAQASLAAGCDEHLVKPISQRALVEALRRWVAVVV